MSSVFIQHPINFSQLGDARLRLNQTLTALVSYRHFAHSALLGDMQYARQHREFAAACLNNAAVAALHSGLRYHGDAVTWLKAAAQLSEDDGNSLTLQRVSPRVLFISCYVAVHSQAVACRI